MIARSDWVYQLEASPSGSRSTAKTVPADSDPINCRLHTSTRAKSLMDTLYLLCGHYAVSLPSNKRQEECLVQRHLLCMYGPRTAHPLVNTEPLYCIRTSTTLLPSPPGASTFFLSFPSIYHVSYMSLADISADSANFEAYWSHRWKFATGHVLASMLFQRSIYPKQ